MRNNYHNESIERFVRRSNDIFSSKIIRYNNEYFQKFDPIFEEPTSKFGKTPFMASTKRIGNKVYGTYNVNVIFIWVMNILLFICLYFGVLKKTIKTGELVKARSSFYSKKKS